MIDSPIKLLVFAVAILIIFLSVRRGYRRGGTVEIRRFIDVLIGFICLALILVLRNATKNHTYATAIVAVGGLLILGVGWRIIRLITGPLMGLRSLRVVHAADALFGIIVGLVEGVAVSWCIVFTLEYLEILEAGLIGFARI